MPKFEELEIKEGSHEAASGVGDMPEERGATKPNLPQKRYTFQLPANIGSLADKSSTKDYGDRLKYDFTSEGIPAYLNGEYAGQWYGRISAVPRNKAKKGEPDRLVSDLTYLAVALGHASHPVTLQPSGKVEFISAASQAELHKIIVSHAGQYFQADNEWSAYCNDQKTRYISDGAGGNVEDPSGQKGCGTRVYSRDIPKDAAGVASDRFPCPKCGAGLLAFQNLSRYQSAPQQG